MAQINPFQNLYVTERLSGEEFVRVVSPLIVEPCVELFGSGNVILQGTQGSGKTTLLTLLEQNIREAYLNKRVEFPVPVEHRNFISAGINLTRSGILDIGKRPVLRGDKETEEDNFPLLFGDFLNYHVCKELLTLILNAKAGKFKAITMATDDKRICSFVDRLSSEDCWFGSLKGVSSINEILGRIDVRIAHYRNYHQFNIEKLPQEINETKTSIGEPISRLARALKSSEIISPETNVLIRIDQLEWLLECDIVRKNLGDKYRRIINQALSTRDKSVSYKIGTRPYAWRRELRLYQSKASLELQRDYTIINVDETLRRGENGKGWMFRIFASDVFRRRLEFSGYDLTKISKTNSSLLVFRKFWNIPDIKNQIVHDYSKNATPEKALSIPKQISDTQSTFIKSVFEESRLKAVLATAWFLQGNPPNHSNGLIPQKPYRWDSVWWKKERQSQGLLQLASNCRQSLIWGGASEVIDIGASGILCFLAICQHVWDVLLRMESDVFHSQKAIVENLPIPLNVQNLGITSASTLWFNKITELPGGHDRQRFVEIIGKLFRDVLLADKKMSYPGWTGFSLRAKEFYDNEKVSTFINDAVDYGILIARPHTSRSKSDQERIKWYPSPILCPYLRIYAARIKEPYYATIEEVEHWIDCAKNDLMPSGLKKVSSLPATNFSGSKNKNVSQQKLFKGFDDDEDET